MDGTPDDQYDDDKHWWHRGLQPRDPARGAAASCFWCSDEAEAGAAQHARRPDGVITRCDDSGCPCAELVGTSSCPACNLPQRRMSGFIAQCDAGHCWDRRPADYRDDVRSY